MHRGLRFPKFSLMPSEVNHDPTGFNDPFCRSISGFRDDHRMGRSCQLRARANDDGAVAKLASGKMIVGSPPRQFTPPIAVRARWLVTIGRNLSMVTSVP